MEGGEEKGIGVGVLVPIETLIQIGYRLIETVQGIDIHKSTLHLLGILLEQLTLEKETIAQRNRLLDVVHRLAIEVRLRGLLCSRCGSGGRLFRYLRLCLLRFCG